MMANEKKLSVIGVSHTSQPNTGSSRGMIDSKLSGALSKDEIEIALNVGLEGEVSILSVASGSANTQSSVVVKLKKKG